MSKMSLSDKSIMNNCQSENIEERQSIASKIPVEIVIHIMKFLPYFDRIATSQVCKLWYSALHHPQFSDREKLLIDRESPDLVNIIKKFSRPHKHLFFSRLINPDLDIWQNLVPHLSSLSVSRCSIDDYQFFKTILLCHKLKFLTISLNIDDLFTSDSKDTNYQIIRNLYGRNKMLSHLQDLKIINNHHLTDAWLNFLLSFAPNLTAISLRGCSMTFHEDLFRKYYPDGLSELGSDYVLTFQNFHMNIVSKRSKKLKRINLSDTKLDCRALKMISETEGLQLEALQIIMCTEIFEKGVLSLATHQKSLTSLDLDYLYLTPRSLHSVCLNLTNLQHLSLSCFVRITDRYIVHLQNLTNLKYLDLSYCKKLTDEGVKRVLCSKTMVELRELNMAGLLIKSDTIVELAKSLPHLTSWDLSWCKIGVTDEALQAIIQHQRFLKNLFLARCHKVTDLGLIGTKSDDNMEIEDCDVILPPDAGPLQPLQSEGGDNLTQNTHTLAEIKGLRYLDLYKFFNITDNSLTVFRFPELKFLMLSKCSKITDVGLKSIAANNPNIQFLYLDDCKEITDEGIQALASSLRLLKSIDIADCPKLTKVSVSALVKHCNNLQYLRADDSLILPDKKEGDRKMDILLRRPFPQ